MRRLKAIAIAFLNTLQLYYTKQEYILVECVPPALYHTGGLPDRDFPWTETPWIETPLQTWIPQTETPWTETPLDREPPG